MEKTENVREIDGYRVILEKWGQYRVENPKASQDDKPQPAHKMTYSEARKSMKEVPVDFRLRGDPRKGSIYAAVITGTDPKYGLKRKFLNGDRTYTGKHDLTVDYHANLKPGTIVETGEGGSWKNKYGAYYIVTSKGLKPLKDNYNGEGKLYVKDLVKAREKATGVDVVDEIDGDVLEYKLGSHDYPRMKG